MSNMDMTTLLKMGTIDNIFQMGSLKSIFLLVGQLFQMYIKTHLDKLESYMSKWEQMELSQPSPHPAKGVLHLQYLALHVFRCLEDQRINLVPALLPN